MNCAAQENKASKDNMNSWQFIERSDLPPNSFSYSDALLTKYVVVAEKKSTDKKYICLLYTSPSPRD